MYIKGIYSIKDYKGQTFVDIVYEWETDLARLLGVPIVPWRKKETVESKVVKLFPGYNSLRSVFDGKGKYLRFVMNAFDDTPVFNCRSCIPIIIDFYVADEQLDRFMRIYDKCEYVFITSRQVYDKLMTVELPFKIVHFPLTLSDRYLPQPGQRFEKKHKLTLFGTQIFDSTLRGYVQKYQSEHPDFHYVFKEEKGTRYVTDTGELVCEANSREQYFELMRASKIVVYSTPGSRGRKDANGYDQVTPKLLEFMASQCQIIPRYTCNSDTEYFRLPTISKNIDTYEDFASLLDRYLAEDIDVEHCSEYLSKHLASTWLPLLNNFKN